MKPPCFFLAAAFAASFGCAIAQSVPAETCAAKRDAIHRDLDEARSRGQKQRVRGLERALAEVSAHCSDAKLQAEHRKRIEQQESKVADRERDLHDAEREGSPRKIQRRKDKLGEAQLQRLTEGRSE